MLFKFVLTLFSIVNCFQLTNACNQNCKNVGKYKDKTIFICSDNIPNQYNINVNVNVNIPTSNNNQNPLEKKDIIKNITKIKNNKITNVTLYNSYFIGLSGKLEDTGRNNPKLLGGRTINIDFSKDKEQYLIVYTELNNFSAY